MKRDFLSVSVFVVVSVIILVFSALIDYHFFHVTVDLATIFLALMIYIISVYSGEYTKGTNLLFVGVAYLSVAVIDLNHLINEGGFSQRHLDINVATQLWMGARFTEAFVLYFAYCRLIKRDYLNYKILLASFGATTLLILSVVSLHKYLPVMYDVEIGYTLYKKVIDVFIIILFTFALIAVSKNESRRYNKLILILAISFKMISQFVYIFEGNIENAFLGARYIFKYISYVFLFMVFARDLLIRPFDNIFRAFKDKEVELIELSRKDSLTGLYNHSTSYEIIRDIINQNELKNLDICLMMIDVDDFKLINDKYGHIKGDEILVRIASLLIECEGPLELAGRYGGDEFVVLLTNCNRAMAVEVAEKIFAKMDELSNEMGIKVTLSIGVSEWEKGFTAKDLVRMADYQMYEAKSVGKNTFKIKGKSE